MELDHVEVGFPGLDQNKNMLNIANVMGLLDDEKRKNLLPSIPAMFCFGIFCDKGLNQIAGLKREM